MFFNVPGHIRAELVSLELMTEQVLNINYNFGGKLEGPYLVTARVNTLCCCIHESQSSRSIVVQIKHQHQRNPQGKEPRKALPPTLYIPLALHPSDQLHPADPFHFADCHHLQQGSPVSLATTTTTADGAEDSGDSASAPCCPCDCRLCKWGTAYGWRRSTTSTTCRYWGRHAISTTWRYWRRSTTSTTCRYFGHAISTTCRYWRRSTTNTTCRYWGHAISTTCRYWHSTASTTCRYWGCHATSTTCRCWRGSTASTTCRSWGLHAASTTCRSWCPSTYTTRRTWWPAASLGRQSGYAAAVIFGCSGMSWAGSPGCSSCIGGPSTTTSATSWDSRRPWATTAAPSAHCQCPPDPRKTAWCPAGPDAVSTPWFDGGRILRDEEGRRAIGGGECHVTAAVGLPGVGAERLRVLCGICLGSTPGGAATASVQLPVSSPGSCRRSHRR